VDTSIRLYGLGWHSFRANGWNLFDVVVASGSFTTTLVAHFYSDSFDIQLLQKLFLVSIAFKLVQRMDSLNQLFKTGMWVFAPRCSLIHPYHGTPFQCQSSSDSESARFVVDALSIFRHHVHGGVWTDKVVLGRE
jgi:hypothetical protein